MATSYSWRTIPTDTYTWRSITTDTYSPRPSIEWLVMSIISTWFWDSTKVWESNRFWISAWWDSFSTTYSPRTVI